MSRVFTNVPRDWGSVPGQVIPDLNVVAIKKGAFRSPSTKIANLTFTLYVYMYIILCINIILRKINLNFFF